MTITVTLIRHGETSYNYDKSQLNVRNVPLTKNGCLQSMKITGEFETVYVSPLLRTLMTLEYSNISWKKLIMDKRVREYKTCICDFLEDEKVSFETEEQVNNRCQSFLNQLKQDSTTNIAVITHAVWIQAFTRVINQQLDHYPDNCEKIILTIPT